MLKVFSFDAGNPLTVVNYFGPGFHQSVKHNIPVEVNDADPGKSLPFFRFDPLTIQRQYFGLSEQN